MNGWQSVLGISLDSNGTYSGSLAVVQTQGSSPSTTIFLSKLPLTQNETETRDRRQEQSTKTDITFSHYSDSWEELLRLRVFDSPSTFIAIKELVLAILHRNKLKYVN